MVNLNLYAWVVGGKQRIAILKAFCRELTPSQLHKLSKQYNDKISMNNASDVVRSFARKGIAVCLTPANKTGRIYKLTSDGEEIRNAILKD
ncbi:MAG: hypothetical protein A4E71_00536 [Smithella sp. PtaU1.Bin162]|nr:MAG: hypothetical protein A4E71_00536 [Smithella sp. PtaU1.Bin162]